MHANEGRAMFGGSLFLPPRVGIASSFQSEEAGSQLNQDASSEKPHNLSDPQLIQLQNAITSITVEAVGSSRGFWKRKMPPEKGKKFSPGVKMVGAD